MRKASQAASREDPPLAESSAAVRPWLDMIDTLREQGVQQDLPLPQIAVMGDQSSGKSSVLESISGIPFPRGAGLVTRCVTQLTMKSTRPGTPWRASVSVSWSGPQPSAAGEVRTPAELTQRIEVLTDVLTNSESNAFSTDSIIVKVEAPGSPDLTLIDLPGIVRTVTAGQDRSVIEQVNSMIESFLAQERTIVLAVIPANQDVATIDILERARRVDPAGVRTLGVLTKPDLIGPGSEAEALKVLRNERKRLKLGYVMVKCRSQQDLNQGMTPAQARDAERQYFAEHPDWSRCPQQLLGVGQLTKRLTTLLVGRIQLALPLIKWELQSELERVQRIVEPLGTGGPVDLNEQRHRLMRVISDYCSLIRQSARGFYSNGILAGHPGLRLFGLCQLSFQELKRQVDATKPQFRDPAFSEQMAKDMTDLRGRELAGFHNSQAFYTFVAQNVDSWRPAVDRCRGDIIQATRAVCAELIETLVPAYPALIHAVQKIASSLITEMSDSLSAKVDDVFKKETEPFTANENMLDLINQLRFKNFDKALDQVLGSIDAAKEDPVRKYQAELTQRLGSWYMAYHGVNIRSKVEDMTIMIEAYWDVATKRLVDNVCMTIEHDFLVALLLRLESDCFMLATEIGHKAKDLASLFNEDPAVQAKREQLVAKRDRLAGALVTLRQMAPDCVAQQPGTKTTVASAGKVNLGPPPDPRAALRAAAVSNTAPKPALARAVQRAAAPAPALTRAPKPAAAPAAAAARKPAPRVKPTAASEPTPASKPAPWIKPAAASAPASTPAVAPTPKPSPSYRTAVPAQTSAPASTTTPTATSRPRAQSSRTQWPPPKTTEEPSADDMMAAASVAGSAATAAWNSTTPQQRQQAFTAAKNTYDNSTPEQRQQAADAAVSVASAASDAGSSSTSGVSSVLASGMFGEQRRGSEARPRPPGGSRRSRPSASSKGLFD